MRIISLVPSITEALCMLGLEDALVGVTDYCLHPAEVVASKTRVGGTKIREFLTSGRSSLIWLSSIRMRIGCRHSNGCGRSG